MRVLVADDEAPARRLLIRMLEQLGVEVVGEASTGLEALAQVGRVRPELLLLDIDMPEMDGLELAARHARLPPVVFVTAHEQHAVRAFELDALDYLLKPVRLERLAAALQRARERGGPRLPRPPDDGVPRVIAHDRGAILVFDARTIDRFHAAEKYTLFTVDGREHMTEEPLVALETRLRGLGFLRVHRGELIRITAVRALTGSGRDHEVHLQGGEVVRVSRRSLASLKRALGI
jgi:DNA-binding LytR/AlgR family response regulator